MKTKAWSHLPNAVHIDHILVSVKAHPEEWSAAWDAARDAVLNAGWDVARYEAWDVARYAARSAARDAALNAARSAARDAALNAAWLAAYDAAYDAALYEAWYAARVAIAALIAWDDCSQYLDMPSEKLEVWYQLSERPECLLLLTAVRAFEQIDELELVA